MMTRKNSNTPTAAFADNLICHACNETIDGDVITCNMCRMPYHLRKDCASITATIGKSILNLENVTYSCNNCKSINVYDMFIRFSKMEQELKEIREQLRTSLKNDIGTIVQEAITEHYERQEKKNNVIVFGIKEVDQDDEDAVEDELEDLMRTFSVSRDFLRYSRIGKPGERPRPLKLQFVDYEFKRNFMSKAWKLKSLNQKNNTRIYLRHDMTRSQQKKEKLLVEELKARKDKGENVYIRNGKIMTKTMA